MFRNAFIGSRESEKQFSVSKKKKTSIQFIFSFFVIKIERLLWLFSQKKKNEEKKN